MTGTKGKGNKVTPIGGQPSKAGAPDPGPPSQDAPPRPPTIEEAGEMLAADITKALDLEKYDLSAVKRSILTQLCVNQVLGQEILQTAVVNQMRIQRVEGMLQYIMKRQGEPVKLKGGGMAFQTWYEDFKRLMMAEEKRQAEEQNQAAEGKGDHDGTKDRKPGKDKGH